MIVIERLQDLAYQATKVAAENDEQWRLDHAEFMDAIQAAYDYLEDN